MKSSVGFYILLFIFINSKKQFVEAIQCYFNDTNRITTAGNQTLNWTTTCEGDLCVMAKTRDYKSQYIQTCISGVDPRTSKCELSSDDSLVCCCNTDFCNNITLLITSEIEPIPIVECRSVLMKEFVPVSCNYCVRSQTYELMMDYYGKVSPFEKEDVGCTMSEERGRIMYTPSSGMQSTQLFHNFFANACYNMTLAQNYQWSMYCRCSTTNCNDPLEPFPFPITAPPTLTCHTGGMGYQYNCTEGECYDADRRIKNLTETDLYSDGECQGHICFIAQFGLPPSAPESDFRFFKGCISANEQGPDKIQMGHSRFRDIEFYFCDTDHCNSNIKTALETSRNSTAKILQREKNSQQHHLTPTVIATLVGGIVLSII